MLNHLTCFSILSPFFFEVKRSNCLQNQSRNELVDYIPHLLVYTILDGGILSCLVIIINSILFQNLIRHIGKYGSLDCEMDQQVVKKIFE